MRVTSVFSALVAACLLLVGVSATAQMPSLEEVRTPFTKTPKPEWLTEVLPQAQRFSEKTGEPPVYRGYRTDASGAETLVGFVFLSADVPPEEKGFAAPIDMLIGMDTEGTLTGLKVLNYTESYRYSLGDFVADPLFLVQFPGKAITDEFRVDRDIDGLAGATMTSFGIGQGARGAARRVAAAYLGYVEVDERTRASEANAREQLQAMTWEDLEAAGMVRSMTIPMPRDQTLTLSAIYMGHEVLGRYLIGDAAWERADLDARARISENGMILIAVGGDAAPEFRSNLMSMQQGDAPARRISLNMFVTAGNADVGAIAGHGAYAGAIVLEEDIDIHQPMQILYRPRGSTEDYSMEYEVFPLGIALADGTPILSEEELEQLALADAPFYVRLWKAPPWGDTPWGEVLILLGILGLVMTAFLRKDARVRWAALTVTLGYLGFYKGGFLSVAHITGAISQGPGIFLNNLPMLMIIVFTVVTTLLWGRVFCSSLCPFGALQDFITRFTPKGWRVKVPQAIHDRALYIKYGILALIVGASVLHTGVSLFQYFEPFGTLFFFSSSVLLWSILIVILIASVLVERFYCRYVCPLGAALGIVSLVSPLRIARVPQCDLCKVCEHACPTGAIRGPAIDFKECVRCDICESKLIKKAGTCRHSMDEIERRRHHGNRIPTRELDTPTPA
ncbi:MAG: 4Fe-4S binding protein [Pseudomonadales bacterium]|nr:4Fe-4S binding protein [Pseudomonadales bacterium]